MVESKRYIDEFDNRIILKNDDKDFLLCIKYSKESLGEGVENTEWLITRKDFEKMQELDMENKLKELKGGINKDE